MQHYFSLVSDAELDFGFASGTGLVALYLAIVLIVFSVCMAVGYRAIASIWRKK